MVKSRLKGGFFAPFVTSNTQVHAGVNFTLWLFLKIFRFFRGNLDDRGPYFPNPGTRIWIWDMDFFKGDLNCNKRALLSRLLKLEPVVPSQWYLIPTTYVGI
jgi:hypothetical protein